ncbi:hypothetical protein HDU87_008574 [Geranomyces variabilis]|uniref:Rho-GAP domain-containing protein n=1 Tax=Geranomyces variabilis TaxID=109894 RepID=A0AAD5TNX6_9FUNG|nr:hypothetical protein HDU87_008574 [Geranomyces variabilis]
MSRPRTKSNNWDDPLVSQSLPRNVNKRDYATSLPGLSDDFLGSPAERAATRLVSSSTTPTIPPLPYRDSAKNAERQNQPESPASALPAFSIPERLDSGDPLNSKCYCELSSGDLAELQNAALKRINALYKHFKIRALPVDILKTIYTDTAGQTKSKRFLWWKPWAGSNSKLNTGAREEQAELVPSVLALHLVRSIDIASEPFSADASPTAPARIPVVIAQCLRFLKAEGLDATGLFRVNGSERRMAQLAVIFDSAPLYGRGISFDGYSVYDVAGFVKRYLRIIPEPLLTTELYPHFLRCLDVPAEGGTRIRAFRLLLMLLPPAHLVLLETILELMQDIVAHQHVNQMSSHNLARIMSPNILRPKETAAKKQGLEEYERGSYVMEYIIDNWSHLAITEKVLPFHMLDVGFTSGRPSAVPPKRSSNVGSLIAPPGPTAESVSPASQPSHSEVVPQQQSRRTTPPPEQSHAPSPQMISPVEIYSSGTDSAGSNHSSAGAADGSARLRRVRTAPTKRNRTNPSSSSVNSSSSITATQLPHAPSSQSLQSLDRYKQGQHLRRKASQQRYQQVQGSGIATDASPALAFSPGQGDAPSLPDDIVTPSSLQNSLSRRSRIQPTPLPSSGPQSSASDSIGFVDREVQRLDANQKPLYTKSLS